MHALMMQIEFLINRAIILTPDYFSNQLIVAALIETFHKRNSQFICTCILTVVIHTSNSQESKYMYYHYGYNDANQLM